MSVALLGFSDADADTAVQLIAPFEFVYIIYRMSDAQGNFGLLPCCFDKYF